MQKEELSEMEPNEILKRKMKLAAEARARMVPWSEIASLLQYKDGHTCRMTITRHTETWNEYFREALEKAMPEVAGRFTSTGAQKGF